MLHNTQRNSNTKHAHKKTPAPEEGGAGVSGLLSALWLLEITPPQTVGLTLARDQSQGVLAATASCGQIAIADCIALRDNQGCPHLGPHRDDISHKVIILKA